MKVISFLTAAVATASLCDVGLKQSPINIKTSKTKGFKDKELDDVHWDWDPDTLDAVHFEKHDSHLGVPAGEATHTHLHGGPLPSVYDYELESIEFYSGSEHEINGDQKRAEIQFFFHAHDEMGNPVPHEFAQSEAAYSVLVSRGKHNEEVQHFLDAANGDHVEMHLADLLPKDYDGKFYTYEGSHPGGHGHDGCPETTTWIVAEKRIEMSRDQLDALMLVPKAAEHNAIHDKYSRTVAKSSSSSSSSSGGIGGIGGGIFGR
jgi:carbonic anhydrase